MVPAGTSAENSREKNGETDSMSVRCALKYIVAMAMFAALASGAGCSYTVAYAPDYVKPEKVEAKDLFDGKVLVYMEPADVDYVYKGSPGTLTGGATTLSVPIGIITREVTRTVWAGHFASGADSATSLDTAGAYRVVVRPRVTSYSYAYHQLENLGFAITPGVRVTLDVALVNGAGVPQWSRSYDSGEVKAGSYMMSFKPEEKVNRLTHQIVADLNRKALQEAAEFMRSLPGPAGGSPSAADSGAGA